MNKITKYKKGNILVRYPEISDIKVMCDYINTLSKEKTYITWQGEEIKLKDEEKYLKSQLEKFKKSQSVQLLLFVDNKLSGISSVDMKERIQSHVGTFGITIIKEHRGKGLGKLLTKLVFDEVKKLKSLKIITLEVFAENEKAIKMYEKFGFKEYGKLPLGNQYKGKLIDDILMSKFI